MVVSFALLSATLLAAPSKPDKAEPVAPEGPEALRAQLTLIRQSMRTEDAEKRAQESVKAFLAPAYSPPQGARFVLFPTNGKDTVDRMFIRYEVKGTTITVAQAMWVLSVQVERAEWAKNKRLLKSEEILAEARRLFKDGGKTKEGGTLKIMDENGPEGHLTIDWGAKGRPQDLRFALHPFELIPWHQDEARLIFWLGKDVDPTSSTLWAGDVEGNLDWFSGIVKPTLPTGEKQK
jgi:hypothetical protein